MKNLLKSIFIAIFPVLALYVLIGNILILTISEFSISSFGSLISALTIVILFAGLFIKPQARTSRNLKIHSFFIILGFSTSVVSSLIVENNSLFGLVMSFILVVCWLLYLKWYSVFENRNKSILKVGVALPEFELEDSDENKIASAEFLGHPAIYLFYRGNWCPLCMAQIKEIAAQYKALEERGVSMNLISPQPHKFSRSLAKKFDVGFNFFTDKKNKVAKQLGIFAENGIPAGFQMMGYDSDTVLPTVIITNAEGKIVFVDLTDNYRVRPEPETFIKVIDGIGL